MLPGSISNLHQMFPGMAVRKSAKLPMNIGSANPFIAKRNQEKEAVLSRSSRFSSDQNLSIVLKHQSESRNEKKHLKTSLQPEQIYTKIAKNKHKRIPSSGAMNDERGKRKGTDDDLLFRTMKLQKYKKAQRSTQLSSSSERSLLSTKHKKTKKKKKKKRIKETGPFIGEETSDSYEKESTSRMKGDYNKKGQKLKMKNSTKYVSESNMEKKNKKKKDKYTAGTDQDDRDFFVEYDRSLRKKAQDYNMSREIPKKGKKKVKSMSESTEFRGVLKRKKKNQDNLKVQSEWSPMRRRKRRRFLPPKKIEEDNGPISYRFDVQDEEDQSEEGSDTGLHQKAYFRVVSETSSSSSGSESDEDEDEIPITYHDSLYVGGAHENDRYKQEEPEHRLTFQSEQSNRFYEGMETNPAQPYSQNEAGQDLDSRYRNVQYSGYRDNNPKQSSSRENEMKWDIDSQSAQSEKFDQDAPRDPSYGASFFQNYLELGKSMSLDSQNRSQGFTNTKSAHHTPSSPQNSIQLLDTSALDSHSMSHDQVRKAKSPNLNNVPNEGNSNESTTVPQVISVADILNQSSSNSAPNMHRSSSSTEDNRNFLPPSKKITNSPWGSFNIDRYVPAPLIPNPEGKIPLKRPDQSVIVNPGLVENMTTKIEETQDETLGLLSSDNNFAQKTPMIFDRRNAAKYPNHEETVEGKRGGMEDVEPEFHSEDVPQNEAAQTDEVQATILDLEKLLKKLDDLRKLKKEKQMELEKRMGTLDNQEDRIRQLYELQQQKWQDQQSEISSMTVPSPALLAAMQAKQLEIGTTMEGLNQDWEKLQERRTVQEQEHQMQMESLIATDAQLQKEIQDQKDRVTTLTGVDPFDEGLDTNRHEQVQKPQAQEQQEQKRQEQRDHVNVEDRIPKSRKSDPVEDSRLGVASEARVEREKKKGSSRSRAHSVKSKSNRNSKRAKAKGTDKTLEKMETLQSMYSNLCSEGNALEEGDIDYSREAERENIKRQDRDGYADSDAHPQNSRMKPSRRSESGRFHSDSESTSRPSSSRGDKRLQSGYHDDFSSQEKSPDRRMSDRDDEDTQSRDQRRFAAPSQSDDETQGTQYRDHRRFAAPSRSDDETQDTQYRDNRRFAAPSQSDDETQGDLKLRQSKRFADVPDSPPWREPSSPRRKEFCDPGSPRRKEFRDPASPPLRERSLSRSRRGTWRGESLSDDRERWPRGEPLPLTDLQGRRLRSPRRDRDTRLWEDERKRFMEGGRGPPSRRLDPRTQFAPPSPLRRPPSRYSRDGRSLSPPRARFDRPGRFDSEQDDHWQMEGSAGELAFQDWRQGRGPVPAYDRRPAGSGPEILCRYFNKVGEGCRAGDKCPFVHRPIGGADACILFQRGVCKYGAACKFIHPGSNIVEEMSNMKVTVHSSRKISKDDDSKGDQKDKESKDRSEEKDVKEIHASSKLQPAVDAAPWRKYMLIFLKVHNRNTQILVRAKAGGPDVPNEARYELSLATSMQKRLRLPPKIVVEIENISTLKTAYDQACLTFLQILFPNCKTHMEVKSALNRLSADAKKAKGPKVKISGRGSAKK